MTGSLVHFSIPATDLEAAANFYGTLFGWRFQKFSESYWMIEGGIGALSKEADPAGGTMPILYFAVSDLEESLRIARGLGAISELDKRESGDGRSFFATIRDLSGNVIGLWSTK